MNTFEDQIEEFKTRSEKEVLDFLSNYWNLTPDENGVFTMIGTYKKADHKDKNGNNFAYFEDIRNTDGDILYYPFRKFGKVKLWTACNNKLENQDIWRISVKLAHKKYREENPFTLTIASSIFGLPSMNIRDKLAREAQIRKIFKDTGFTERDAKNTVHALHNIMDDLYSNADDRFVYELLQNADDQPEEGRSVSVSLQLLKEHLLFMHSGKVFDTYDVDSICSIGDSTKRKDKEKIGYKGIGFKSVFTRSDTVIINSGNYSFAFDKFSPIYGEADMNGIPWQLKPIWQERYRYPKEIKENDAFWKEHVGISLEIDENNLKEYRMSIAKIFSQPIFLLFLKNVDKLEYNEDKLHTYISKTKEGEILKIERDGMVDSSWLIKDYVIPIPLDIKEALQDDRNVPEKLKEATLTQISFAAKVEDGKITKINNSVLYAYLPTTVNDFGFSFIVNADFLLAANREQLHVKKIWNQFLFNEIGKYIVDWVASLSRNIPSYLELFPSNKLKEEESGTLSLSHFFNKSFADTLESTAFILNHKGELAKQEEIIIDKTGLSNIVGADLFCKLLGTDKFLPSENIDSKILSNQIFEQVEHITNEIIHCKLKNNADLNEWYIHADKKTKDIFNKWVVENDYKDIINSLPIFEFDDGWKSPNEIDSNDKYVVISTKFSNLKNIIIKIGLRCSIPFDNEELYQIDEAKLFDRIYKKIVIHNAIVTNLHQYSEICAGVGQEECYYSSYYGSLLSDLRDGNFLTNEQEQILSQINPNYFTADDKEMLDDGYNNFLFYDFPNTISQFIDQTRLTPQEKLLLINTDFYGIGEAKIKEIELFYSIDNDNFYNGGEPASLQNMLPYRIDAPNYIKPYMISEKENFPEIQKYLISPENEFSKVIMPHLSKIVEHSGCSLSDIIRQYNLEGSQLRDLINDFSSDYSMKELLPFIEDSDKNTKEYFLNSIKKLELSSSLTYKKDSYEYRVLQLALKTLSNPSDFSSKIYFDGQCIKDFTVSDDVICEYIQNGKPVKVKMSLAKLLPQYQNQSDSIEKIKGLFESKKDLDKFFVAKPKSVYDVHVELNQFLKIPERIFSNWTVNGNAQQYLFATFYRRHMKGWWDTYVPKIDLVKESQEFVYDLLSFLCANSISIEESPFTYHLKRYFENKYFKCDYISKNEQLLPIIENWADNDEKKQYLIENGVREKSCLAIQFRKLFLENKTIDFLNDLSDEDIASGIKFIATVDGFDRPFIGNYQKEILLRLKEKECCNLEDNVDNKRLKENFIECEYPRYKTWVNNSTLRIFISQNMIPNMILYNNILLLNYDDYRWYYNDKTKELFVKENDLKNVLLEFVDNEMIPFSMKDYTSLFPVVLSDDYETLCKENKELKDEKADLIKENEALKKMLEQYNVPTNNLINQNANIPYGISSPTITKVCEHGLDDKGKLEAQLEAQKRLIEEFPEWTFPNNYGECDENGKPYNFSTIEVEDNNGMTIPIVLKSYKNREEPFKINTEEWDYLIKEYAVLLIYTGDDIKRIYVRDLVRKQSNIAITFSTENLDLEDRVNAFADSLHYFNELHFDFESFNISESAKSAAELYHKNKRAFFNNDDKPEDNI